MKPGPLQGACLVKCQKPAELISLGFIGVAINSFLILATDHKPDVKDRLKQFGSSTFDVELGFGHCNFFSVFLSIFTVISGS